MHFLKSIKIWWLKKKISKARVEKDLIPYLYKQAEAAETSVAIEIDKILRRHLIEGHIYRCCECHSANVVLMDEGFDQHKIDAGKHFGACFNHGNGGFDIAMLEP